MEQLAFKYQETTLYFLKAGKGSQTLLAFHGFGQDHQAFTELFEKLSNQYTIYTFDIFFHGKSEWSKGETPLEKSFWKELLTEFLSHYKIERFNLLGFSMGGKFALASLEAFPGKIDKVFLLAPDGIKTSAWYSLATYPVALRKLFRSMITNPNRFYAIAHFSVKIGIIDKGILRFVESQMSTKEKREQVYYSWVVFRHLKFDVNRIASIINANNINLTLVIGKYDKIITLKNMQSLLIRLKTYNLEIPETGHNGVIGSSFQKM